MSRVILRSSVLTGDPSRLEGAALRAGSESPGTGTGRSFVACSTSGLLRMTGTGRSATNGPREHMNSPFRPMNCPSTTRCSRGSSAGPGDVDGGIENDQVELERFPGGDLVGKGLRDLERRRETVEAPLVSIAAPRLRDAGLSVPHVISEAEHRLY